MIRPNTHCSVCTIQANTGYFAGFHLEILSRGGKSGDHRNKRGQQQKQSLSNVESCVCMTSNVSSENCHYFDVYMEHEEHVYCRKDRSVQQGVVREGDVPTPARSAKLKVIFVKTLNFKQLS